MGKPVILLGLISSGIALLTVLFLSHTAQGQQREGFKNLQHFPKDITRPELIANMRNFSFALGVACTHCHGTEEQTGFNLRGVDFSLDIKPAKSRAREMLKIVKAINVDLFSGLDNRSPHGLQVTCFTCHSGASLPESIEHRMMRLVEDEGVDAAIEDYRKLRERYHGSAAYNFLDQPLVEASDQLLRQDETESSLKIAQLNLEFHPKSGQSLWSVGQAQEKLGNVDGAREAYQAILEFAPNNRRVQQALENLKEN